MIAIALTVAGIVLAILGLAWAGNTLNSRVGPIYATDGPAQVDARQGSHAEGIVQQSGGKYKEATKRGNVYSAMTAVTGVAPGTALGTTAAFCLYNPSTSTKNLIVQKLGMGVISGTLGGGEVNITSDSIAAGAAIPTGTAITPRNRNTASANASVATPLTTATVTTTAAKMIGVLCSLTEQVVATTAVNNEIIEKDIDGEIVIPPGSYICLHATAAAGSTPLVVFTATWEEEAIAA
jgi:hypothetical protein